MKSRRRTAWLRFLTFLIACALSLGLLEGMLTAYAWARFQTIDVAELTALETGNSFAVKEPDGFPSLLHPHPYLGSVKSGKNNFRVEANGHRKQRVNNVGFIGRDFPLKRDPSKFTILFTGGSVAEQLAKSGEDGRSYLEAALNDRYDFGREVVVLNGAVGAWKQPQQAIVSLLYGDVADAVVTLDGFNECVYLQGNGVRLEKPMTFDEINPLASGSFEKLAVSWQCQQLKHFAVQHDWRTVYFSTRLLRTYLEQHVHDPPQTTSTRSIFKLPDEWPKEERTEYNVEQFEKYIRTMNSLCDLYGAKRAFIVQPCPAIGKTLTAAERKDVGDLGYRDAYLEMESRLLKLGDEGLPVVSLTDVFRDTAETIYCDHVHCECEKDIDASHKVNFRPSKGYRIMSDAIADRVAKLWSIPPAELRGEEGETRGRTGSEK